MRVLAARSLQTWALTEMGPIGMARRRGPGYVSPEPPDGGQHAAAESSEEGREGNDIVRDGDFEATSGWLYHMSLALSLRAECLKGKWGAEVVQVAGWMSDTHF